MKEFRYATGHSAGRTMTVGELRAKLAGYPEDMPVMAEWEDVKAYVEPENFSVQKMGKGYLDEECEVLLIWVEEY